MKLALAIKMLTTLTLIVIKARLNIFKESTGIFTHRTCNVTNLVLFKVIIMTFYYFV